MLHTTKKSGAPAVPVDAGAAPLSQWFGRPHTGAGRAPGSVCAGSHVPHCFADSEHNTAAAHPRFANSAKLQLQRVGAHSAGCGMKLQFCRVLSSTGYVGVTEYQPEHKLSPKWRTLLSNVSSMPHLPHADSASSSWTAAPYLLFTENGMTYVRVVVDFPVLHTTGTSFALFACSARLMRC